MIDELVQFAVGAGAAASNVAPSNFNPVPADGFLSIWGCLDSLPVHTDVPDAAASISVTIGGATPFTPIPNSALRVNVDGVVGAGPSLSDIVMKRQAVRQGTNLQIYLNGGGTDTHFGRFRVTFESMEEVSTGSGSLVS